jgi:hypothetical protein
MITKKFCGTDKFLNKKRRFCWQLHLFISVIVFRRNLRQNTRGYAVLKTYFDIIIQFYKNKNTNLFIKTK